MTSERLCPTLRWFDLFASARMPDLSFRSPMPASPGALYAWHARDGAFARLTPPWANVHLKAFDGLHDRARATIRMGLGPVPVTWVAEHRNVDPGRGFDDVQVRGPFARWEHRHRMESGTSPQSSVMNDALNFEMPFGDLGGLGEGAVRRELTRQFGYRHRTLQADLGLHTRLGLSPLRVAMTGASGLIGRALTALLTTGGHEVVPLVRRRGVEGTAFWDPRTGEIEAEKLAGVDAVVHLAGEPVAAPRWSDEKKARILASRQQGTDLIARTVAALRPRPRVFVSASAVGIYGDRPGEVLTEVSTPSETGFLPLVCRMWEQATAPAADAGIRTVTMRTGVVLTPAGGALATMLPFFRAGVGGPIGGAQVVPWITLDDVLGAYLHALGTDALAGPVNVTSPAPVSMTTLARAMGRVLSRPAVLPVPASVLEAVTGEMGREVLLASADVRPERLVRTGYSFRHPDLELGLRHILGRARAGVPFPGV